MDGRGFSKSNVREGVAVAPISPQKRAPSRNRAIKPFQSFKFKEEKNLFLTGEILFSLDRCL